MRHRAALVGAALACALMAGPGPAATVGIPQNDPAGTAGGGSIAVPQTSNGEPNVSLDDRQSESGSERDEDSLGPEAVAVKGSGGSDDNAPDAVSSAAGPEPSALTRLMMVFADLRATVFGGP